MVDNSHLDLPQRVLESLGNAPVGVAGLGIATGMIENEDDRGGVVRYCFLDDLTRVDAGRVDGAAKQLLDTDHSMLAVEENGTEHLVLVVLQQNLQVLECQCRLGDFAPPGQAASYYQNLCMAAGQAAALSD